MKKKIWIPIVVVLVLIAAAGAYMLNAMAQPLYKVGMVSAQKNLSAPLDPPAQSESDYFQVEKDIRLWHFEQGQGSQTVLMIHGGPGEPTRQEWKGLEPLSSDFQFVYYDQRGCGKSTRPIERFESKNMYENMTTLDQTLGIGAQIADIERIRRIRGEDKIILIGHSWGGFLAALYAAEFPEHVQALVLVSPATTLVMPQAEGEDLFESVRQRLPTEQRAEYDTFMKDYMDFNALFQKSDADLVAMNRQFGEYYVQSVGDAGLQTDFPEQGEPGGWMVWAQYVSMGQRHDYRPALKNIQAPALVIHGANDLQPEAASRQYADLLPNAQFIVIPGATHFSFDEQPQAFSQTLINFLGPQTGE